MVLEIRLIGACGLFSLWLTLLWLGRPFGGGDLPALIAAIIIFPWRADSTEKIRDQGSGSGLESGGEAVATGSSAAETPSGS